MSKDTIYIEPEDDITDIITKIENSKSRVVALVPPKKAGVFRSVVNIKLIAKAGKTAEKSVVLVTVDPSITKLAAASKLPVAKSLQSAPSIPSVSDEIDNSSTETVDEDGKTAEPDDATEEIKETDSTDDTEETDEVNDSETESDDSDNEDDEEPETNKEKKDKKAKKSGESKNRITNWIKNHKKLSILILILILGLIGFLIWALFFAPAVNVAVSIKTETNKFSEVLNFVKDQNQENIKDGKVFLEERKIETVQEVNFEATGQKNLGEKATGEVIIYAEFPIHIAAGETVVAGDRFTISGLSYLANETVALNYSGKVNDYSECDNVNSEGELANPSNKCRVSTIVKVTAAEPGEKYNIARSGTGWSTTANVVAYSDKAMGGGTDKVVTVVQQIDIEKARDELKSANEEENKKKLYESIPEDSIILESTFSQTTSNATATPAVDEEVKEGVKPTLKTTTTTSVFIIDKTKLEELIRSKVELPENKKIYEIRDVYIDGFRELDSGFTGKLKAKYFVGPKITESEVVDKIKGKGLGDAQREIRDIEGVTEVKMNASYPWVFAVPTDSNKITVSFDIKDQDGQKIEEKTEGSAEKSESDSDSEQKTDEKKSEN